MVRLTDRPDMTLDVYRGRKATIQQQQQRGATFMTHCMLAWRTKVSSHIQKNPPLQGKILTIFLWLEDTVFSFLPK